MSEIFIAERIGLQFSHGPFDEVEVALLGYCKDVALLAADTAVAFIIFFDLGQFGFYGVLASAGAYIHIVKKPTEIML